MKHVFIINPKAGKTDQTLLLPDKLAQAAQEADVAYEIIPTQYKGHATELARQYGESGEAVRLYSCGGDGTLNELFRGGYPYKNVEVACLPYGSGNDFLRSFGTQAEFLSVSDAIAGCAIEIDLIRANEGVSAAICSAGLDAAVAYHIPKYRRLPFCGGSMAYNLSIVENLCKPIGRRLHIEIDGEPMEENLLIVTVCNGVAYGGGYLASPNADLQDGKLEVLFVRKMGRLRASKALAKYKVGKHLERDEVIEELRDIMTYRRAERVDITVADGKPVIINIDGECGPAESLHAQVMPRAARFVLPAPVYARYKQPATV